MIFSGQQLFHCRNALKIRKKGIISRRQLFYYRNAFKMKKEVIFSMRESVKEEIIKAKKLKGNIK